MLSTLTCGAMSTGYGVQQHSCSIMRCMATSAHLNRQHSAIESMQPSMSSKLCSLFYRSMEIVGSCVRDVIQELTGTCHVHGACQQCKGGWPNHGVVGRRNCAAPVLQRLAQDGQVNLVKCKCLQLSMHPACICSAFKMACVNCQGKGVVSVCQDAAAVPASCIGQDHHS